MSRDRELYGGLLTFALLVWSQPVYAYIDHGTGSMLLQGLLAGVAGLVVVLKLYWYKIKNYFLPNSAKSTSQKPETAPETAPETSGEKDSS